MDSRWARRRVAARALGALLAATVAGTPVAAFETTPRNTDGSQISTMQIG